MAALPTVTSTTVPPTIWPWWLLWSGRLIGAEVCLWLVICLLIAMFQRRLIYHPRRVPALPPPDTLPWATVEPLRLTSFDGLTLNGWRVRPRNAPARRPATSRPQEGDERDPASSPREETATPLWTVLYFCGNAGHRGYRLDEFELLIGAGAEVCCFDYRGYGDNPGHPREADLHRDARSAWNLLTGELQIPAQRILLLGESLGGGVATRLAADLSSAQEIPGGLILRSTFSSLREIAATEFPRLPVNWLLLDPFESQQAIGRVTCPVLSLHGERDTIVPLASGRALFNTAPATAHNGRPKTFVPLPQADHNDVLEQEAPRVRQALDEFLSQLPVRP